MFKQLPIKRKLIGGILLTSGTVLALTCGSFLIYELVAFRQSMVSNLSTLARVIASNSTAALAFDNVGDATDVLSALAAEEHIMAAGLYDQGGVLFATYPPSAPAASFPARPGLDGHRFTTADLVIFEPAINGTRRLGTVYVQVNLTSLYNRLFVYGSLLGGVLTLSLVVALVLSNHLQGHISRPVLALVDTATRVAEQRDYSARAERFDDDELGRLTDAFNEMLTQIQAQDAALRAREERLHSEIAERALAQAEIQALHATLEHRVYERTEALAAANTELETFSYTVSHDLRAPLRHIHGYGEMLQRATEGQLPETAERYLRTIIAASGEMTVLIDDLLNFSRIARVDMHSDSISLSALAEDAVRGLEMATRNRQIAWQIGPLPEAVGDPAMIRQILVNLIGNAVKYTGMRDPARIEIGCAGEEDGRMIVFVRDNGAGFDPQYTDKLFGVFQRLHRAEEFEGTGIGLAIVRRIATRHGGRVWAEGALDQGATFYFTLQHAESRAELAPEAATCRT
jgi:light-regulated signal transduction histidine kinase (bacteriophytochrome)